MLILETADNGNILILFDLTSSSSHDPKRKKI